MRFDLSINTYTVSGSLKASATVTASEPVYAVECRATRKGEPWGRGIGTDVMADDVPAVNGVFTLAEPMTVFSFDVEAAELVRGDGQYNIILYVLDGLGVWSDTLLIATTDGKFIRTADGYILTAQKG